MTHPVIPPLIELAQPLAGDLGLEVVGAVFQTNQRPPVLRVDVRNPYADTSVEDCERMSRALEAQLDARALIEGAYVLEISSPGLSSQLTSDRDFLAFRGFAVTVTAHTPHKGKTTWHGRLQGRDAEAVYVNQKGKSVAIPTQVIAQVALSAEAE